MGHNNRTNCNRTYKTVRGSCGEPHPVKAAQDRTGDSRCKPIRQGRPRDRTKLDRNTIHNYTPIPPSRIAFYSLLSLSPSPSPPPPTPMIRQGSRLDSSEYLVHTMKNGIVSLLGLCH